MPPSASPPLPAPPARELAATSRPLGAPAPGDGPRAAPRGAPDRPPLRERWRLLPDQLRRWLRPDPAVPARVWLRRHWAPLGALALLALGVGWADAWVLTCGWAMCPSTAEIRAFRPSEGGRVVDRRGQLVGPVRSVRRVNVPLAAVPLPVRQRSSPPRTAGSTTTVGWTGTGRGAPCSRTSAPAASARGSAPSRCRWCATRSPPSGRASAASGARCWSCACRGCWSARSPRTRSWSSTSTSSTSATGCTASRRRAATCSGARWGG
jgi:hypothetical protein